jgi:NADPH:quinone reductase-like Zn-dependent oxidoreductase
MSVDSKKMRFLAAKSNQGDLEFIVKLVEEGKIHPVIERSYSLDQAAEAMRYLGEGHAQGKVIIKVG